MNKRGSLIDGILWMVMAFIIVMFFGMWLYGINLVDSSLADIDTPIGANTTVSEISADTFGQMAAGLTQLRLLSFVLIIGMILTIFISNFLVKAHPVFFIPHVFINILGIILAVIISNTYETFLTDANIGTTLQSFSASNFILLNLPYFAAIVGFLGAIFLFAGIIRDSGAGGSVI